MHPRINSISGPSMPHKLFWLGKNSFRQHQTAAATIVRPKVMHLVEQRPKKKSRKIDGSKNASHHDKPVYKAKIKSFFQSSFRVGKLGIQ